MKLKFTIILLGVIISYSGYSQKKKDNFVFASSTLNYYPELESYSFFRTLELDQDNLILTFLTANSGTFVIEDVASQSINEENINKFPTQIFNIGASFQIRNQNSAFQEFSLSRLSSFKSSNLNHYSFRDTMGNTQGISIGYKQKSFIMSLRYEYGKMFGDKKDQVRFGLSGILEPNIYAYKREVTSSSEFPVKANIYALNIALAPIMAFKLSDKVFFDVKLIPRVLIADFGTVEVNNPTLPPNDREGVRDYNLPEIDIAATLQLRYLLKEPKKKRRKSND